MKQSLSLLTFLLIGAALGFSQGATPGPASDLKTVLAQMDAAGKDFKSAQADIELVQYTKVVDDSDVQTGQIFFRRKGSDVEVALRVIKPHAKQAVIKDGKVIFYDPKINQTTERDITNNRTEVESLMNLGFGGRGQDLLKDYDVKLDDWEMVDNIKTAKLELVPKGEHLKRFFSRVILWIDPERDVPVKQQRFQSSGDYQLTHYTNIKFGKISDEVFRLKKTGSPD